MPPYANPTHVRNGSAPSMAQSSRQNQAGLAEELRNVANTPPPPPALSAFPGLEYNEIPVASGNGVAVSISMAEPMLFLRGFEPQDALEPTTSMLRGTLKLRVSKSAKIKTIYLRFRGRAETEWPEGIPPRKTEFKNTESLINHTWTFFNASFPDTGNNADSVRPLGKGPVATTREVTPGVTSLSLEDTYNRNTSRLRTGSPTPRELKRLSLQAHHFHAANAPHGTRGSAATAAAAAAAADPTVPQKGYRLFPPGEYSYAFELPIDARLPETAEVELGRVRYELEALVERAGAFRANLVGRRAVPMIRAPAEGSLEAVEPIAISRDWEDQLHYDIVISGKSFPLGGQVPIAFKLTPLAKVQCHRVKVLLTENVQYFTTDQRVHRLEPARRVLLFEKRADAPSVSAYPGSTLRITAGGGVAYDGREAAAAGDESVPRDTTNLLGNLLGEHNVGPTEMEACVQLPTCHEMMEKERGARVHFDTTYANIRVNHWIKIVLRLSRPDTVDPGKRRHFEISIDSPLNILSCRATQANISLPAYSSPESRTLLTDHLACGCPGSPRRLNSPPSFASLAPPSSQSSSVATNERHQSSRSQRAGSVNVRSNDAAASSSFDPATAPSSTPALPVPPAAAHIHDPRGPTPIPRPMHLLRAPSFNPPAFTDDVPPPTLAAFAPGAFAQGPPPPDAADAVLTPPPRYESLISGDPRDALADYFSRLADWDEGGDDDEGAEEGENGLGRGRVEIPLTPGGRVHRSMDAQRTWLPVGAAGAR